MNEQAPGDVPARELSRQRQDAIHRALLAGLLGNVGVKLSPHEYQGAGKKFSIFPGSALFKRGPEWVMAAELVETTRLYARTVGPARADWVERLREALRSTVPVPRRPSREAPAAPDRTAATHLADGVVAALDAELDAARDAFEQAEAGEDASSTCRVAARLGLALVGLLSDGTGEPLTELEQAVLEAAGSSASDAGGASDGGS